jgi:hypothetical protein
MTLESHPPGIVKISFFLLSSGASDTHVFKRSRPRQHRSLRDASCRSELPPAARSCLIQHRTACKDRAPEGNLRIHDHRGRLIADMVVTAGRVALNSLQVIADHLRHLGLAFLSDGTTSILEVRHAQNPLTLTRQPRRVAPRQRPLGWS